MPREITVTEKHIREGVPGSIEHCPVVFAMIDAGYRKVRVVMGILAIFYRDAQGHRHHMDITKELAAFICACYDGKPVYPFTFTVPDICSRP